MCPQLERTKPLQFTLRLPVSTPVRRTWEERKTPPENRAMISHCEPFLLGCTPLYKLKYEVCRRKEASKESASQFATNLRNDFGSSREKD